MYTHNKFNFKQLLILIISICTISAYAKDKPPSEYKGMLLKEDAKVDLAYVRPDVDWKKFKSVYIRTLTVTEEAIDASEGHRHTGPGTRRESWIIPEKDVELMKSEFTKIMKESFIKAGINVVNEVAADTLVIVPTIIDIHLNAAIEKSRKNYASRGGTYTEGAGSMTLSAIFADGDNLRVVAYAVDNKYASSFWKKNTRMQNISDMKRVFRSWGKSLGKAFNKKQE